MDDDHVGCVKCVQKFAGETFERCSDSAMETNSTHNVQNTSGILFFTHQNAILKDTLKPSIVLVEGATDHFRLLLMDDISLRFEGPGVTLKCDPPFPPKYKVER